MNARLPRRGSALLAVCFFVVCAATLLAPGLYIFVQSTTGTPGRASVDDCETTGSGRYERTDCSGSWIVGGDLLDGGHVIVGTVEGAEQSDMGKTIDVMLHGDRAYTRSLVTPVVLLAFGGTSALAALFVAFLVLRRPRA